MALTEDIQQKLDQEKVTEASARDFFKELQENGGVKADVSFDDPTVKEAVMLYVLKDSLTVGARLRQLDEVGLSALAIRKQFFDITGAGELFSKAFKRE